MQIVALTEVDWMAARSGKVDQCTELCALMPGGCKGYQEFFMTNLSGQGYNGIALVSNAAVSSTNTKRMLYNNTCNDDLTANGHGVLAVPVLVDGFSFYVFIVHAPGLTDDARCTIPQ